MSSHSSHFPNTTKDWKWNGPLAATCLSPRVCNFLSLRKAHALCQNDQNDCSHFRRMPSGLITKPDLWHCDLPWLGLSQHIYTSENTMSMATTKCFMCRILIQGLALATISSLHNSIGEKSRNGEKSLLKMMCGRKIQQ